jgi:rare lipoprotein A
MNQQLWSGLTTAAFFITSLSTASASRADQSQATDDSSGANVSLEESLPEPVASSSFAAPEAAPGAVANAVADAVADAVKVGEYQSQDEPEEAEETIALIQPHEMSGRQAATLFVRDIPVLTFLGGAISPADSSETAAASSTTESDVKVATVDDATTPTATQTPAAAFESADDLNDPVWRATATAARLNQFHRDRLDAKAIRVTWDADRQRYLIRVNDEELVEINADTILPDTTADPAEDALQATNRLRRQMGDAPPLRDIEGRPQPEPQEISLGPIQVTIQGLASWYGPGFNGNRSASGEIFNQNALTAAHRTLPFGTQVRVTNLRNGRSVVVRINDRGPYHGRRVIDLSAAAARAVGLIQSGVAPVSIDVLGTAGNLANHN